MTIHLDTNMVHFEKIYFGNGQGSVFHNHLTRRSIRATATCIALTVSLFLWALQKPEQSWLIVIGLLTVAISIAVLTVCAVRFCRWKKQVNKFLSRIASTRTATLTLNQNSFQLQMNEEIIIQKLDAINQVHIQSEFIQVFADNQDYLFPLGSMSTREYNGLTTYFREHV